MSKVFKTPKGLLVRTKFHVGESPAMLWFGKVTTRDKRVMFTLKLVPLTYNRQKATFDLMWEQAITTWLESSDMQKIKNWIADA